MACPMLASLVPGLPGEFTLQMRGALWIRKRLLSRVIELGPRSAQFFRLDRTV